jgi:hypothetical protein
MSWRMRRLEMVDASSDSLTWAEPVRHPAISVLRYAVQPAWAARRRQRVPPLPLCVPEPETHINPSGGESQAPIDSTPTTSHSPPRGPDQRRNVRRQRTRDALTADVPLQGETESGFTCTKGTAAFGNLTINGVLASQSFPAGQFCGSTTAGGMTCPLP